MPVSRNHQPVSALFQANKKARSHSASSLVNQQYESNYGDLWGCCVKVLKEQVTCGRVPTVAIE